MPTDLIAGILQNAFDTPDQYHRIDDVRVFGAGEDIAQDVIGRVPDQVGFGFDIDVIWQ